MNRSEFHNKYGDRFYISCGPNSCYFHLRDKTLPVSSIRPDLWLFTPGFSQKELNRIEIPEKWIEFVEQEIKK